jgi:hypothetical protein
MTTDITDEVEEKIQKRYAEGVSMDRLHKEYGVTRYVIRGIILKGGGRIRCRGRVARPKPEPVLTQKLKLLAEALNNRDASGALLPVNDDVLTTIVLYALRLNDGRTFRKIDRRYDYDGELSAFRREQLESSYYFMGKLWRYAYKAVLTHNTQYTDYGVAREDARLLMRVLDAEELEAKTEGRDSAKARILAWLGGVGEYVHLPNEDGVHRVVKDCMKTMNTIVGRKLRFIYQYDPAFEKSDLVTYLLVIAYRVAIKYDWEMKDGVFDYTKCLNYTNRSLWNAATLLIKEIGDGGVHSRLTKTDTDERVYQVTTISMDTPQDDEWFSIESKLGESPDTTIEIKSLISSLADSRLNNFLELDRGEDNQKFNEFVLKMSGKSENILYADDYNKWRELAQKFSGLSREVRVPIKQAIRADFDIWDNNKMGSST